MIDVKENLVQDVQEAPINNNYPFARICQLFAFVFAHRKITFINVVQR